MMILGSTRAWRVVCGALAANSLEGAAEPVGTNSVRRGAERSTRGRVRSPDIRALLLIGFVCLTSWVSAAEVVPPKPDRYFNDYAGVVSKEAALRFNEQLAQFERETSHQFLVAVWNTMPSQSSIEDFTQRTFQAWRLGQVGKNNGVVLFVFIKDRRMRIQPGYGLEGALPDIICDQIIRNEIAPRFRGGNYEGGLAAGVDSIIAAVKGEYKGSGKTFRETGRTNNPLAFWLFLFFFILFAILIMRASQRGRGYRYSSRGGPFIGGWSGGSGGGWSSGGGGGFSGFSGGGGSSGGGGASGGW